MTEELDRIERLAAVTFTVTPMSRRSGHRSFEICWWMGDKLIRSKKFYKKHEAEAELKRWRA